MEELVGKLWDRLITHAARATYPEATVTLAEMAKPVGVLFRALGGEHGLRVEATSASRYRQQRNWLQRLAGSGKRVELPWRNEQALRLPAQLAVFPTRELNRELYLWLSALAAEAKLTRDDWFVQNQWLTRRVLQRYPGLTARYHRLVQAQLAIRPELEKLPADEAAQERAIRSALQQPGQVNEFPLAQRLPQPVWLWLYPAPQAQSVSQMATPDSLPTHAEGDSTTAKDKRRRQGERVDMPDGRRGLLFYRFETLLSWADYVKVDRCTDDEEDMDNAQQVLDDLDTVSIARDTRANAKRLRFDLDLPGAANDDIPLGDGMLLPEWHYQRQQMQADFCRVQPMLAADATACALPAHLRRPAQRLRAQFEALALSPTWHRAQMDGSEVDIDAYLQHLTQQLRGDATGDAGLYRELRRGKRDMACLVLADLSLSTDSWINNEMRVIDVIRDALYLFAETLSATGDQFAIYGFSSLKRQQVRLNWLKGFKESYNARVRGRLAAIKPGYYTRMGAAIRYASKVLLRQAASQRLLLILTDGKPNDLDQYEGRYGAEDTRRAILEARQQGLRPLCVTIDDEAGTYLPHLFGSNGFVVIRQPSELPRRLPLLYAQLTG
ncbi:MAG: VWA domain-containing protein [Gammaproteobacteria bacterium]|nr:VWA domain-containing protein [Gammaproteobacteria bacterium]